MPSEIVRSLAPYQSEFVDQFLTANSERQQLLIGSPGSGLTRCASEIVSRMMSQDPGRRVLILAERRMLVLQWLQQLQDSLDPALILEGSRRNLRESTGNIKVTDYLWPEGHVVVMDAWAFERFDDLQSTVFRTSWDLVVWDRFSAPIQDSDRIQLLEKIRQAQHGRRVLILSSDRRMNSQSEFLLIPTTLWDRSSIERSEEGLHEPIFEQEIVSYTLTAIEITIKERVKAIAQRLLAAHGRPHSLVPGSVVYPPADRLVESAYSSPAALQEALYRLRPSKPTMVLRQDTLFDESDPLDTRAESEISEEIAQIQELLDGLSSDSKLEAFLAYLRQRSSDLRIVVVCRLSATARYLKFAVADLDLPVSSATADLKPKEIVSSLNEFSASGRILIGTVAILQGIELAAEVIVAYDFGDWPSWMIRSRVRPRNAGQPVRIVRLRDSTDEGPWQDRAGWEN